MIDTVDRLPLSHAALADTADLAARRARIHWLRELAADEATRRDFLCGTSMIGTVRTD